MTMTMTLERFSGPTAVLPVFVSETLVYKPVGPARSVRFTFDIHVGGLRRNVPTEIATKMCAAGLDVSWVDARAGLFGVNRRFTVSGTRALVQQLVSDIGVQIGWQPGAMSLSTLTTR